METDITQSGGTEEGIANGMQEDIGIAVAYKAVGMGHTHTTEPKGQALTEAVHVISSSYTHYLVGIISMERPRRMVLANGLVEILVVGMR